MPIHEYVCQTCGKKTEVVQGFREKPLKICPHCGGKLKKVISAPAIQFKGSGWYITDYARAKKEEKKEEKPEKAASSSKAEGSKSESAASESGEKRAVSKKEGKKQS